MPAILKSLNVSANTTNVASASFALLAANATNAYTASYVENSQTASYISVANGNTSHIGTSIVSSSAQTVAALQGTNVNSGSAQTLLSLQGSNVISASGQAAGLVSGQQISPSGITSSLFGTASYSLYAETASYVFGSIANAVSASYAVSSSFASISRTASYIAFANVDESTTDIFVGTSSYATTAKTASLALSAQTASYILFVQTASFAITSSYISFANVDETSADQFAGTASYSLLAQTASYIALSQTASYVVTSQTASFVRLAQTASYYVGSISNAVSASYSDTASFVRLSQTASYVLLAQSASYASTGLSSSYSLTASYAINSPATVTGSQYYLTKYSTTTSISSSQVYDNGTNVGIGTATPAYKLEVNGTFAALSKSFVITHPTKKDMKLQHGVVEGPEHSVYIRGKTTLDKIKLPDYWKGLVHEDSITVHLTPIATNQILVVKSVSLEEVTIQNKNKTAKSINCYYHIQGERKDISRLEVEY